MKILEKYSVRILVTAVLVICSTYIHAQNSVGIGTTTPDPNAVLDLQSPTGNQGILVPRLSTAQRTSMSLIAAQNGMLVYDTNDNLFYYWDGTAWTQIGGGADDDWVIDGTNPYVYNTTDNIGIGTVSPTTKLDIQASSAGSQINIRNTTGSLRHRFVINGGDNAIYQMSDVANVVNTQISADPGSPSFFIGSSVGVGTTTPGTMLEVSSPISTSNSLFRVRDNASGVHISFSRNTILQRGASSDFNIQSMENDIVFSNGNPLTEKMRIEMGGNIGIGITTPTNKLHVFGGSITVDDGVAPYTLPFSDGASGDVLSTDGAGNVNWQPAGAGNDWSLTGNAGTDATNFIGTTDAVDLAFRTNNVEGMRILSNGDVGIGITSTYGNSKFHVNGGGIVVWANRGSLFDASGSSHGYIEDVAMTIDGKAGHDVLRIRNNLAANLVVVNSVGNIGVGVAAPSSPLDVLGNVEFSGDLRPNNLPGNAGEILTSQGAGLPPVWQSSASANAWSLTGNAGTDATNFIGTTDAVDMVFRTNNIETARLASNGRFGIGDFSGTGPLDNLEIRKSISSGTLNHLDASQYSALQFAESGSVFGFIGQWGSTSATNPYDVQIHNYYAGNGGIKFSVNGAGNLTNPAMTIANNANVGIGTTTPSEKLHVAGNALIDAEITGGTNIIYDITQAGLVNLPTSCSASSYYGSSNYGITWNSTGAGVVTSIVIQLNIGVDCSALTSNINLNGNVIGTISSDGDHCSCTVRDKIITISPTNTFYNVGANNQITIDNLGTWGLNTNSTWPAGVFARVTVNYGGTIVSSGDVIFSGALQPGGNAGTSGFILTSAGGNTNTWSDPSGFADGNGIYNGSGSLSGNTIVTQGANTLSFTSSVTNGFNVDGTTFSVDAANDRVGIGTTAPARKFEVNSAAGWPSMRLTSSTLGTGIEMVSTTTDDWLMATWNGSFILANSTDDFATQTDQYYFTNSGIFPWTNGSKDLGLSGNAFSDLFLVDRIYLNGSSGAVGEVLTSNGAGDAYWSTLPTSTNIYNTSDALTGNRIVTQGVNTLAFTSSATNGFSVDGTTFSVDALNNRVGIGTTAPTYTLEVNGTIKGIGQFTPTNGFLGVQGTVDFDGDTNITISGQEIGVLGISTGTSIADNYGVYGWSNNWGGHFQHNTSNKYVNLGGSSNAIQIVDGTQAAGRVLTSDASGNGTWQTPSAGITGSGTATRLAFWNSATSLTSNANLYWDNTNSRLGVGTASPNQKLQVNGDVGLGSGAAGNGFNKAIVVYLTNNSGGARSLGDIVISSGANAFSVTTTAGHYSAIGVLTENCAAGTVCPIAVAGVTTVRGGGNAGEHCITSTTLGRAGTTTSPANGTSIGVFLTNSTGTYNQVLLR